MDLVRKTCVPPHDFCCSGRNLFFFVSFIPSLKSNSGFWPCRTLQELTVSSHKTAIYRNVFLTGIHRIHRLLVSSTGWPPLRSANNCQGQLKTLKSVWVSRSYASSKETKENMTLRGMKRHIKA
jgi:hypothetical protein